MAKIFIIIIIIGLTWKTQISHRIYNLNLSTRRQAMQTILPKTDNVTKRHFKLMELIIILIRIGRFCLLDLLFSEAHGSCSRGLMSARTFASFDYMIL